MADTEDALERVRERRLRALDERDSGVSEAYAARTSGAQAENADALTAPDRVSLFDLASGTPTAAAQTAPAAPAEAPDRQPFTQVNPISPPKRFIPLPQPELPPLFKERIAAVKTEAERLRKQLTWGAGRYANAGGLGLTVDRAADGSYTVTIQDRAGKPVFRRDGIGERDEAVRLGTGQLADRTVRVGPETLAASTSPDTAQTGGSGGGFGNGGFGNGGFGGGRVSAGGSQGDLSGHRWGLFMSDGEELARYLTDDVYRARQDAAAMCGGTTARFEEARYLTDGEKANLLKLADAGNFDGAMAYYRGLEDTLAQRSGQKIAETTMGIGNPLLRNATAAGLGFASGTSRAMTGLKQAAGRLTEGNTEPEPRSSWVYANQAVRPQLTGLSAAASDLAGAAGFQLPGALTDLVLPGAGSVVTGIAAGGDSYGRSRSAGRGDASALLHAGADAVGVPNLVRGAEQVAEAVRAKHPELLPLPARAAGKSRSVSLPERGTGALAQSGNPRYDDTEGAGKTFSPINPGSLDESIANTFRSGTYTKKVLTEDTTFYRVYGGGAGEVGLYMSRTPQFGGMQSQLDLALNPKWGNAATHVTKVTVPKGTVIYEGFAAPQTINGGAGFLMGGGNQIYIPEVNASWFGK